jgi:hypothetical protein
MDRFGYKKIFEELNGRNIHRSENIFTLDINVHAGFDALEIWFESTVGYPFRPPFISTALDVHRIPPTPIHSVPQMAR